MNETRCCCCLLCRWNFTPSPGWTQEESLILKLCLMKFGIGQWVQIQATGLLPGKLIQQLCGAAQRLVGQQSLAGGLCAVFVSHFLQTCTTAGSISTTPRQQQEQHQPHTNSCCWVLGSALHACQQCQHAANTLCKRLCCCCCWVSVCLCCCACVCVLGGSHSLLRSACGCGSHPC